MTMCHQKDPRPLLLAMAIVMLFGAIERPARVHAQGAAPKQALAIDFAGSGTGRVTATPGADATENNCFNDCTPQYDLLDPPISVTLTATPTGFGVGVSSFAGWSGEGCTGTGSCVVSMSTARSVTATFDLAPKQALAIDFAGSGTGRVTATPGADATENNCFNDCTPQYDLLDPPISVTLTATPTGFGVGVSSFAGWSGEGCTGTGSCVVSMSTARSVTATFMANPTSHTLTVTKNGTGGGTVTSSPSGISCGGDCSQSFANGTGVTLTAAASVGSSFGGWSGSGCAGTGSCVVSMSTARSVTATFDVAQTPSLAIDFAGSGTGRVTATPGADATENNCFNDCTPQYDLLDPPISVTLTATPTGFGVGVSSFAGWSGEGCTGTGSCVVNMSTARSVTATFMANPTSHTLTVTKNGTGGGTVTSSPSGISCGGDCSQSFANGTGVTLTAAASVGSSFGGWSGSGCAGAGSCVVSMTSARSVTATFDVAPSLSFNVLYDLNNDAKADIVWRNTSTGDVAVWLGNRVNAPTTTGVIAGAVPLAWKIVGIGDVNGDGTADIVWRNTSTGDVAVWLGNGVNAPTTTGVIASGVPLVWKIVGIGDVNGDGTADIIWRNTSTGDVAVWLGNGVNPPTTTGVIAGAVPLVWKIAGIGDVNGDGTADIIWRNTATGDVAVWLGNHVNPPTTTGVIASGVPLAWKIVGIGDVDGDGTADIIWRNTATGDVAVWLGNGMNPPTTTGVIASGVPAAWVIVNISDVDGDGKADIVFRNTVDGSVAVWLGNGVNPPTTTGVISGAPIEWEIQP